MVVEESLSRGGGGCEEGLDVSDWHFERTQLKDQLRDRELIWGVVAIAGHVIDVLRNQYATVPIEPQCADGEACAPRELADREQTNPFLAHLPARQASG